MMDTKELRELAQMATSIVIDADMNFYRPSHGYGNIPIIEGKLYDVPMNKPDVEYYRSVNPTTVLSLLDTIERYEKALTNLTGEWLMWPAKHQSDPRIVQYESRTLIEIKDMAREALNPKEGD